MQSQTTPKALIEEMHLFHTSLTTGAKVDNGRHCRCQEFDKWGECDHTETLEKLVAQPVAVGV